MKLIMARAWTSHYGNGTIIKRINKHRTYWHTRFIGALVAAGSQLPKKLKGGGSSQHACAECRLTHSWCCRLQQRQKLRERREQRAKAAEDDRRNGLTEAERAVREAKAAKNMEALLQELDEDAARAAAKQDTRRARRKGAPLP